MSMFDLTGKVAIVTGGNSGIGLGFARGLAGAGANVVIAARNEDKNSAVVAELKEAGGRAFSVRCDVSDEEDIQQMAQAVVEQAGGIDILVNNAGTNVRKVPEELSYDEWKLVLSTNLDSAFLCSRACFPAMKKAGAGKILNNGSMLSIFGAPWGSP